MSKYFITFASSNNIAYLRSAERLINQAKSLNLFDKIILYTDEDLKNDIEFYNQHSIFINKPKEIGWNRGYGYWIWKSHIIKKTMEQMKDNDILLYLDCGCEIDIVKKEKIIHSFNLVKEDYIIGTCVCLEKEYNKMDILLELDMLDEKYLNTPQRQSGVILFLVCDKTRNLINKWYEISCNYHMIDDSPSIAENLSCFKEHRHDQSVFSLLTKKYNLFSKHSLFECINVARNYTDKSFI
jgi:hypothetical protein